MNLKATLKARKAMSLLQKNEVTEALKIFDEAFKDGLDDVRSILTYSVFLIRAGRFEDARAVLVSIQKKNMQPQERSQLYANYATCVYKMGELEKGVALLERQHKRIPCGLIYQTLGYLLVEAGEAEQEKLAQEAQKALESRSEETNPETVEEEAETSVTKEAEEASFSDEDIFGEGEKKSYTERALEFNLEALDYDDEDSIVLDNLGQVYYRLLNDKKTAKEYFEKAIAQKEDQIDTLYFLAQYDLEEGKNDAAKAKLELALKGRFSPLNYASKDKVQSLLNTL